MGVALYLFIANSVLTSKLNKKIAARPRAAFPKTSILKFTIMPTDRRQ